MSKEILQNIINDFNANKFTRFFREKSRTFAPIREELSQYNDEFFSNGIKLGEIQFSQKENPPSINKGGNNESSPLCKRGDGEILSTPLPLNAR